MSNTVSTKERDYLEQDPDIRGQKYVCLSFLSPEEILARKDVWMFGKFIKKFSTNLNQFLEGLAKQYPDHDDAITSLKTVYDFLFNEQAIQDEYRLFVKESSNLEREFHEENNFQTSMRGIKVRGSYDTLPEAKKRIEDLRLIDKAHNIYIAEVGCWCPWNPSEEDIKDQEYSETQLNTMMKKYRENMDAREAFFSERKEELRKKAEAAGKKKVDASGNIVEIVGDADFESDNGPTPTGELQVLTEDELNKKVEEGLIVKEIQ